jgi:hypothetical protein
MPQGHGHGHADGGGGQDNAQHRVGIIVQNQGQELGDHPDGRHPNQRQYRRCNGHSPDIAPRAKPLGASILGLKGCVVRRLHPATPPKLVHRLLKDDDQAEKDGGLHHLPNPHKPTFNTAS